MVMAGKAVVAAAVAVAVASAGQAAGVRELSAVAKVELLQRMANEHVVRFFEAHPSRRVLQDAETEATIALLKDAFRPCATEFDSEELIDCVLDLAVSDVVASDGDPLEELDDAGLDDVADNQAIDDAITNYAATGEIDLETCNLVFRNNSSPTNQCVQFIDNEGLADFLDLFTITQINETHYTLDATAAKALPACETLGEAFEGDEAASVELSLGDLAIRRDLQNELPEIPTFDADSTNEIGAIFFDVSSEDSADDLRSEEFGDGLEIFANITADCEELSPGITTSFLGNSASSLTSRMLLFVAALMAVFM